MKYLDEFRDPKAARSLANEIAKTVTRPWIIMEICGGQTHSILKYGIDKLLPEKLKLVHGPGCPVCVTPVEKIDRALAIAKRSDVIFTSFGDMLRVPGSDGNLFQAKARGADVRIVYSPLDAVNLAKTNPSKNVVFFGVGFETTAPANAMAVIQAKKEGLKNFSMLVAHVLVPPAVEAILSSPANKVKGFLAAGHVCTVMGFTEYEPISAKFHVPFVVTGFEPTDILQGILMCVKALEKGQIGVENQYSRSVKREGNIPAQKIVGEVMKTVDRKWRGIGLIPNSGLDLKEAYSEFDAEKKFDVSKIEPEENPDCLAGLVLRGEKKPTECPMFDNPCSPENPLGAPMVSSEGACAAYFKYRRN